MTSQSSSPEVQQLHAILKKRMNYGEHPAQYLAALLDPRCVFLIPLSNCWATTSCQLLHPGL